MIFENCQLTVEAGPGDVMRRATHLRHKVFVEELKYEPASSAATMERTSDDSHSLHFIFTDLTAPPHQKDIGCVRLILPGSQPDYRFPCQRAYNSIVQMGPALRHGLVSQPHKAGETSRLTIDPHYRQQAGMRHLAVFNALVLSSMYVGSAIGLEGGFILAEPRMATHLQKHMGICVEGIAPPIEHHGVRAAYWVPASPSCHRLTRQAQAIFKWTANQLHGVVPKLRRAPIVRRLEMIPVFHAQKLHSANTALVPRWA